MAQGTSPLQPGRSKTTRKPASPFAVFIVTAAAIVAVAAAIAVMPWPVAFGSAVVAATGWCLWLEHHPDCRTTSEPYGDPRNKAGRKQ
jgi:hypothetical protein